jgi:hypothetical protein
MAVRFPRRAGAGIRITATRAWALAKKEGHFRQEAAASNLAVYWRKPMAVSCAFVGFVQAKKESAMVVFRHGTQMQRPGFSCVPNRH